MLSDKESSTTPLEHLSRLSRRLGIDLRVKRDDLFPMTGGGNKARLSVGIMRDAEDRGCNALVTMSSLQSNHARVTALAAAARGWRCKLILHGNPEEAAKPQGNLLLMHLAGADIEVVEPSGIAQAMRSAMDVLRAEGFTPYEIPGGGHCVAGAMAYVEAAKELGEQCQKERWHPEWIILASATGTTLAGLSVGVERLGWQTRVLGISIARRNPRGRGIVEQMCRNLWAHLGVANQSAHVDFRDDWVGEGYEKASASVLSAIRMAAEVEGIILDPTYTGKAFAALLDLVRRQEISKNASVLFWHTGGLLNLVGSDYFTNSTMGLSTLC